MNFRPLLLCATAALAGWHGMAWWPGRPLQVAAPLPANAGAAPPPVRPSNSSSSTALAAMGAELSRLSDAAAAATIDRWNARPPGTARTLALAMLKARVEYGSNPFNDPFGPPAPEVKREPGHWESLKAYLLEGHESLPELVEWVALDPPAATAAILQIPAGESRGIAVNSAADALVLSDPAAAWDIVAKSGEKNIGPGAAKAWALMVTADGGTKPPAQVSPSQAAGLCAALTSFLEDTGAASTLRLGNIEILGQFTRAISALPSSPAKTDLVQAISRTHSMATIIFLQGAEKPAVVAQTMLHQAADPAEAAAILMNPFMDGYDPAALSVAAPRLAPLLADSGHVETAAQVLPSITDPDTRRATLEAILPQWMDANPAAARAAFHAAPFTALERERWLRHPAFLLNP